ncbi:Major facilitator superfamily domain, general substrate transporter [Metarhizium guizhouense ARSEF 977]|uniref:Major facilitator superfamily domain, general substrate transporter n=1 Tax=Metarhizium guizhouense (strain ARSEF 977) TaxID=1276136 RepID=A0A0B4HP02_METGA|nr:Major facilitator superfamily domain, general substrate transporter [Metarhizium guizhouense ARSEF 977]
MAAPSSERKGSSSGSQSTMTVAQRDGHDIPDANNLYPGEKSDEEKAPSTPEEPVVADGGTVAWLVVLGAWCVSFCSFGWINSVGAFQEYYQHNMLSSYSASTISWIPSLQIFFMNALGPAVGMLYDRYGPRQLLLAGSFLHVFGLMMCSLGTQYYQILLAQGVCSAVGVSAIFQPSINVIHGWFNKKRGAAFGILATGSSLGGVIFPIMVSRLIRQVGFPWAMRTCAFLILALLIVANLTIRAAHPPRPQKLTKAQLAKPFSEFDFVFLCAGFFCFTFGIFVPIDYLPVQALDAGVDPNLVQYLLSILNAASLFGRLFSGIVGDKIGRYNIFVTVCALTGIWVLALWIPSSSTGGIIAFAALFGFCSGAYVSLIGPLVAQISPLREIGFRTGIIFFIASIGGLTTNPISGAILGDDKNWVGVKVFAGVFCFAGTFLVLIARIRRTGWKLAVVF